MPQGRDAARPTRARPHPAAHKPLPLDAEFVPREKVVGTAGSCPSGAILAPRIYPQALLHRRRSDRLDCRTLNQIIVRRSI